MKKVLFTVAALGLGLTLAASVASAASFSAAGKYQATGIYVSDGADGSAGLVVGLNGDSTVAHEANDAIWHSAYFYPTINVNDNITVRSELRFIDRDFFGTTKAASDENMRVFKLWMEYDSPIGLWAVGRQPAGT